LSSEHPSDATSTGFRPSFGSRLVGIEGLRAAAASSILIYHAWLYSPGGQPAHLGQRLDHLLPILQYGVVLFFTLSGFLLYRPFAGSIVRGERLPSVRRYLRNRALRILPAYWVILFLCAVVLGSVLIREPTHDLVNGRLIEPGLFAQTATFASYYNPNTVLTGIGPAWSLSVEVVFYLTLPLLVVCGVKLSHLCKTRRGRRAAAVAPVLVLLGIGLTGKAVAAYLVPPPASYDGWGANWHSVLERSFLCHADLFAFGMALAVARVDSEDGLLRLPRWWRGASVGILLASSFVLVRYGEGELSYSPYNTLAAATSALLLALVVLPVTGARRSPLVRLLETRPFVAIGVVSYSVFLWHEPLIRWLDANGLMVSGGTGFVINLAIVGGVVAVASVLTYRFVEAPALRLKFRSPRRQAKAVIPAADVQAAP
jgi:peptidoglycan/LPS O-acetylase OafA/YrhL